VNPTTSLRFASQRAGGCGAAGTFSEGYVVAMAAAGALSLAGAVAAVALDARRAAPELAAREPTR
jgi:hypothetical protein